MAFAVEASHHRAEATYRPKANRLGLWLFIASESFLFAAFISTRYINYGTKAPEELNQSLALILTIVLLVSSISAYLGETAIAHDDRRATKRWLSLTILFAAIFLAGVVKEFSEASEFFPISTTFGSIFYMVIGLHAFHVVTGAGALAVVLNLVRKGHFGSENSWWVEAAVKYWHFVDLAWVVIYPTIYLVSGSTK